MKKLLFLIIMVLNAVYAFSQSNKAQVSYIPKVGDTIMDYTFNDVINYNKNSVSVNDFRGKWLVLDFWSVGCTGCIASMPKINKMRRDFKDKANVLFVGLYGQQKDKASSQIKKVYSEIAKKKGLNLVVAFDSASFDLYKPVAVPYILIVDPNGIIKAKTYSLDSTLLANLISNKKTPYKYTYSIGEKRLNADYNRKLPLLEQGKIINESIERNAILKSVITSWTPEMPIKYVHGFDSTAINFMKTGIAEAIGVDLPDLLRIAYTGTSGWLQTSPFYYKVSWQPIYEVKDVKKFAPNNLATGENMYSCSIISKSLPYSMLRNILLEDLERTFDFSSHLETRPAPVWKLIVIDQKKAQKLRSKVEHESSNYNDPTGQFNITNMSIKQLIQFGFLHKIINAIEGLTYIPIVDSTGIEFNIDLTMNASYYDFEGVRKVLNNHGLDLVKGKMPMQCIVVTDRNKVHNK